MKTGCPWKRGHEFEGAILLFLILCCTTINCLCPATCRCNEDILTVWCDEATLYVVPITFSRDVHVLHLNGNEIKSIKYSFAVYQNLRFLDMSQNLLETLGHDNFLVQRDLRILHLNNNKISSLKAKAFIGLSALQILRLDGNAVSDIDDKTFEPLYSLEKLDLSRNNISILTYATFSGLINLKELLLRDNRLTRIPTESFQNVKSLHNLDLGMNYIYVVPKWSFHFLRHLQVLSLDGCGIHIIENGAFHGLENNLRFLILRDNQLATFTEDMLPWEKLDVFDVRENPLMCNCTILWLLNLLKRENFTIYGENVTRVRCKDPPIVSDQLLIDIGLEDLDCGNRALKQILSIAIAGAGVLLVAVIMLAFWHRYKYPTKQKNTLGQSK